ncbi:MAG TPA: Gfo/Idh/MocA family oxidoreductase [Terriglobales bacterium]|jgi:myo-inositol 2-dehydrogenase/D-chiro-inositol 1-dehydrogenase
MTNGKKKLNVALIGSGFMGAAHSNAFCQVGHFFDTSFDLRLKVICARDRGRLDAAAARWGWEETETDWRKAVTRPDIQVVDVAVPNAMHAPIARAAAEAGKIVLCEKPLATSLPEAEEMANAARNVPNLVWFNYRRVPAVVFAKQLLSEGTLGRIFHFRATYLNASGNDPAKIHAWRYQRADAGSGASGDLLSHSIDTAFYLNGPITELVAMNQVFMPDREVDDATALLVRFANGSTGTLEATRFGIGVRNRNAFEMNCEGGMLRFDLEDMNYLDYNDTREPANVQGSRHILVTGPNHPYSSNFWKPGHALGYEHTFIATLGDFLTALSKDEVFHPNFDDALAVQRVLDAAERSAATRTWVSL